MDLEIGSNRYRNTDGTVEVQGVAQITVARKSPEGPWLLSLVLFDDVGRITLKMVDGTLAFNERRAYELTKTATGLTLTNTETGQAALQVEFKAPDLAVFKQGSFMTARGQRLEISPTEWRLGKQRQSGTERDLQGKSVNIE